MGADVVPVHGNYRGYYTKRQAASDVRLPLVPKEIFENATVLDVGCNEGWVTCEVAQIMHVREVIGVDIDDKLVQAAWKRRQVVWSQQEPPQRAQVPSGPGPIVQLDTGNTTSLAKKRKQADIDEDTRSPPSSDPHYFPACFEHMFGPLPIPPCDENKRSENARFPYNITFRAADWVKDGIVEDKKGYDLVLAFSITKWIHLNEGDAGLVAFFSRCYTVLRPNGHLVLEPQQWETYAKAKRMDDVRLFLSLCPHPISSPLTQERSKRVQRLRKNATTLKLRPDRFSEELTKVGFEFVRHLGSTGKGGFHRPIDLYKKPQR